MNNEQGIASLACNECLNGPLEIATIWRWRKTYISMGNGMLIMVCPHIPGNCTVSIPPEIK